MGNYLFELRPLAFEIAAACFWDCGRLLLRLRPPAFEIVPSPDFKMSIFRCGVASKARHATSSQNHRSFKFLLWQSSVCRSSQLEIWFVCKHLPLAIPQSEDPDLIKYFQKGRFEELGKVFQISIASIPWPVQCAGGVTSQPFRSSCKWWVRQMQIDANAGHGSMLSWIRMPCHKHMQIQM